MLWVHRAKVVQACMDGAGEQAVEAIPGEQGAARVQAMGCHLPGAAQGLSLW